MKNKSVQVKWTGNRQFIGTDSVLALASCSAYDVVGILQKKRLQLDGLDITAHGEQEPEPPWTYRNIHLKFIFKGPDLTEKAVEQAIELSITKYCSVAATVSGKADVTHEFEILGK
jgi:putative redox protein